MIMGREVRMVPPTWQHPKNERGEFRPLHEPKEREEMECEIAEWYANQRLWSEGKHPDQAEYPEEKCSYTQWAGDPPNPDDYMPCWADSERTHFQMYEDTTEGTPISPVFATPEELARWLDDSRASAFGNMTATYEQWLATIKRGWAPSMIADGRGLQSGVAALEENS